MTDIEQKAREIADKANLIWADAIAGPDTAAISARLGIIEGLEMAHRRLALVHLTNEGTACDVYLEGLQDAAHAIRALIEENSDGQ